MTDEATKSTDIVIIGAGPVGMALARSLLNDRSPWRVLLVDRRARGSHCGDPRALALAHGTQQLLCKLSAWNARAATPIHDIHISRTGGFGRTLMTREEQCLPALGHVVRYGDLAAALDATLPSEALIDNCEIETILTEGSGITLRGRRDGQPLTIRGQLIVHAEGTPIGSDEVFVRDYRQHAVLAEVSPQSAHANRAWERFTPDGPLALLPLGEAYAVVFSASPERADKLMEMDDTRFLEALQRQFGDRIRFAATTARARFPLALRMRRRRYDKRQVWIGNAAQTLHPVSGQGFNLGMRDAVELAAHLSQGQEDAGDMAHLAAYARNRQLDRHACCAFTDSVVRIFSNTHPLLDIARGGGLALLDLAPPLRRFVASRLNLGARGW